MCEPGLKKQFNVGDPASVASDKQSQEFHAAFQIEIKAIGVDLEYTATNADAARHNPLATRRDALYPSFQGALGLVDKDNPNKAKGAIDKALGDARALKAEVTTFRQGAEKAKSDWESRQRKFDEAVKHIEELEAWTDPAAPALRGQEKAIRSQTNERKYAEASKAVDELLANLQTTYDAYVKQKTAKEKYDAQFKQIEPKLPKASLPEDKMSAVDQKTIADGRTKMESAAQAKDFVKALEWLESISLTLTSIANRAELNGKGDPDVIIFESKELRADKALLKKLLVDITVSQGIKAASEFSGRLQQRPKSFADTGKREGLFPDILTALNAANDELNKERKDYCAKFETTANKAAEGLLDQSKQTIEAELKRLGIIEGPPQVDTGSAGGTARPGYRLSNPEAAKAARKAANDLLPFAQAVEKTGNESKAAFDKFTEAQRGDPFNLTSRPLAENHQALKKQWQEASEAYEKARRTAVGANPVLAMFVEQPGVVVKLTALASMSDDDLGNKIGQEAKQRLDNIEEVKRAIGGQFTVWKQTHLTRVTLDQMSATPFERAAVEWEANERKSKAEDDKKLFTLLALGLGLVAIGAALTGIGLSVAGAAGGEMATLMAGISTAATEAGAIISVSQVMEQVNEYTVAAAANATDFDKAKAISLQEPHFFELALNCVLAVADVFAAAAAFKTLGPLVKATKGGDVAAAMKLGSAAERVGVRGTAKAKIVGEAVSGLSGEAIEKVAKSVAKTGGTTEAKVQKMISLKNFRPGLDEAMNLLKNIEGRIPETAKKMVRQGKVKPMTKTALQEAYGAEEGYAMWLEHRNLPGFYSPKHDRIFLNAGSEADVVGTLVHEATHRMGMVESARPNDFVSEAIAHFAEKEFYDNLYGVGGALHGHPPASDRIKQFLDMNDVQLMDFVERTYGDAYKNVKNVSADQIVEELMSDLAKQYKRDFPSR